MTAILFGSISTVADTSELQREAFNQAFVEHGLDWAWDRDTYLSMLESNGGVDRIAEYADARGEDVDAQAVHATKSAKFQQNLASSNVAPRPGVVDTIVAAKDGGMKIGLVTTTSGENIAALMDALAPEIDVADFDVVVDASDVDAPKPDSAAYDYALAQLDEDPAAVVAVEDNLGGVQSAKAAGVTVVAFPNQNTAGHDFEAAATRVESLDLGQLTSLIKGA